MIERFRESSVSKVKYTGLRKWMIKNRINIAELERQCRCRLMQCLVKEFEPRKSTIDDILRVTGLTYEECFKEDNV